MVEPHVFCGPEFLLEVPRASVAGVLEEVDGGSGGWVVTADALLRIQTAIYGVCSVALRHRLHQPTLTSSTADAWVAADDIRSVASTLMYVPVMPRQSAPPPPTQLQFLSCKPTGGLSVEEKASVAQTLSIVARGAGPIAEGSVHVPLLVTDSRVAGELHMLCLRNASVSVGAGCRLYNYFRATARAAAVDTADLLRKKEALLSRYNLDEDLWEALETAVHADLLEDVLAKKRAADEASGRYPPGRILTAREEHQQRVEALLLYCEANVTYAGVLDAQEAASPLLIAMGLFFRLRLTMGDLYAHFVRHHRRAARMLALLLARYVLPPEELAPFFYPSLHDEVVVATTADARVTCAARQFARDLLERDEVSEAWLPVLHPFYAANVVTPAVERMGWLWSRRHAAKSAAEGAAAEEEDDGVPRVEAPADADGDGDGEALDELKGTGRGVASLGFRSIRDLNAYAQQQQRALVPQSMSTLVAARYRRGGRHAQTLALLGGGDDDGNENDNGDDDSIGGGYDSDGDDDDFLINVAVDGGDDDDGSSQQQQQSQLRKRPRQQGSDAAAGASGGAAAAAAGAGGGARRAQRREEERLDPHAAVLRAGYRVVMDLLGRRQPFDRTDERHLQF